MRALHTAFVATVIASLSIPPVQGQAIPLETLQHLKSATAFIKARIGDKSTTGSGFLIERVDGSGFVVTNAHVIDNDAASGGWHLLCS